MNTRLSILCLMLVSAGFFGCYSTSSSGGDVNVQTLFPLAVGDSWTYRTIVYNNGMYQSTIFDTTRVVGTGSFRTFNTFLVVSFDRDTSQCYYENGGTELWYGFNRFGGVSNLVLRYPLGSGDSSVILDTNYADSSHYQEVLYLRSKTYTVASGTQKFVCYRFERTRSLSQTANGPLKLTGIDELCYGPGVGLVSEVDSYYDDNGVKTPGNNTLLKSYVVN